MDTEGEKQYYNRFLGKFIRVVKVVNGRDFFYKGYVKAIFDDKLILEDIKQGNIPISFEGMTVMQIKDKKEGVDNNDR